MKTKILATAAVAVAFGAGLLVPRIQEVGRVADLLTGSTFAYGAVHVTVDTLDSGLPMFMVTAPLDHLTGLHDALLYDAEYQRALRVGLTRGSLYSIDGAVVSDVVSVVPVLHMPDMLLVATADQQWRYLHRSAWDRLEVAR